MITNFRTAFVKARPFGRCKLNNVFTTTRATKSALCYIKCVPLSKLSGFNQSVSHSGWKEIIEAIKSKLTFERNQDWFRQFFYFLCGPCGTFFHQYMVNNSKLLITNCQINALGELSGVFIGSSSTITVTKAKGNRAWSLRRLLRSTQDLYVDNPHFFLCGDVCHRVK